MEAELADKRGALADASQSALETERALARRRAERSRVTVAGPQVSRLDQVIREVEEKVLEAQRDRAQATADAAEPSLCGDYLDPYGAVLRAGGTP
jgi:hypothetical protein